MGRLEDLKRGASVKGILPDGLVTVVDVKWHGSVESYYDAKKNIFRFQSADRVLILNAADPSAAWKLEAPGRVELFDPSGEPF